jgi:excisionase family DNA binding protein
MIQLGFSKRQAAQVTSLSVRTLDYLIQKGRLCAKKIGRRVIIPSKELNRLLSIKGE